MKEDSNNSNSAAIRQTVLSKFADSFVPLNFVRLVWASVYQSELHNIPAEEIARVLDGEIVYSVNQDFVDEVFDKLYFLNAFPLYLQPPIVEDVLYRLAEWLDKKRLEKTVPNERFSAHIRELEKKWTSESPKDT